MGAMCRPAKLGKPFLSRNRLYPALDCCENEIWRMYARHAAVGDYDDPPERLANPRGLGRGIITVLVLVLSPSIIAQRAFEKDDHVIYEGRDGKATDLGVGFSPAITQQGQVALIRGRFFMYGEEFDCKDKELKNWVAVYDPATRKERTLFDSPLPYWRDDFLFCTFQRMQLAPNGSTLYLTSPVDAVACSLAIISLKQGTVAYVPGVEDVYVIVNGPHRGELLYQQRMDEHGVHYPFVHARADGEPIRVLAEEYLYEGLDKIPQLKAYLRRIGGQIIVNGQAFPK